MRPNMESKLAFFVVLVGFGLTILVYNFRNQELEAMKTVPVFNSRRSTDDARSFGKMNWPVTNSSSECSPISRIVYLKTHKSGSTTTASIFQRFGYHRNLRFALPKGYKFSMTNLFSSKYVEKRNRNAAKNASNNPDYNMLVNHARYNRLEMDKVVPDATYVTILRDPVLQLESAFGYFEMAKSMGISNEPNPFETFVNNSLYYYTTTKFERKSLSRNGQLFDLGFDPKFAENTTAINTKIHELDKELDLVMITDYFDESLILLKKLLWWSFDDILYISNGVRSQSYRYNFTDDTIKKIRRWNAGDVLLYDHFNKSFWRQVREYGPDFYSDLEKFRKLEKDAFDKCVVQGQFDHKNKLEDRLVIHKTSYCQDLFRSCVQYTSLLRKNNEKLNKIKSGVTGGVTRARGTRGKKIKRHPKKKRTY